MGPYLNTEVDRGNPYSLVYGMEAFLPIEVQITSLRIMKDAGLNEDD